MKGDWSGMTVSSGNSVFDQVCSELFHRPLAQLSAAAPPRPPFVWTVGPVVFDFSKTHWHPQMWEAARTLWPQGRWSAAFEALTRGEIINTSEKRAALHTALRGFRVPETAADGSPVRTVLEEGDARMQALVRRMRRHGANDFDAVLHIGMGGSVLGPAVVVEALAQQEKGRFDVRFLSNIDGHAFDAAIEGLDPRRTLVVAVSKSWTTAETRANLDLARKWLMEGGVVAPARSVVAVTAATDKALADGILDEQILPFGDWVGGRFSVWSPVGVTIALQYGWEVFQAFRAGGRLMDEHVAACGDEPSAPTLAAVLGYAYARCAGRTTRAVFPYDERLCTLVPYLQQLELESNGKSVKCDGSPYEGPAMPVVWGDVGASAQHAVFQWLHQATDWAPVDFIAVARPDHRHAGLHRSLLANCLAQAKALMTGTQGETDPARIHTGNRPSTLILLDRLTPEALGALLAFYEHRTYAYACLMGINCFDQMGVELGKRLAGSVEEAMATGNVAGLDPSTANLVRRLTSIGV